MKPSTRIPSPQETSRRPSPDSVASDVGRCPDSALPVNRPSSSSTSVERRLLARMLARLGNPPIAIELWDGQRITPQPDSAQTCLKVLERDALLRMIRHPQTGFAKGYTDGALQIEGDLLSFLRVLREHFAPPPLGRWRRAWDSIRRFVPWSDRLQRVRKNIYHHYDIGNEFYRLWLDERMLYTCAYYDEPDVSLEQAQVAKMDHVCRKLQLKPGESVIEAGCGWGGFALHMAEHYGVTVRAFNISHEQVAYARDAARQAGLDHRVEFVEQDWRKIDGACDAFVSIGMLEHVGIHNYRELGDVIDRCLRGGGRGLIHTIGRNYPAELNSWILQNIFPGAEPPSLSQMMDIFEQQNLSVLDVENIRLHYAVTLKDWLDRFEWHLGEVRDMFDDRFIRMWRLYLASSIVAFEGGALQLFQVLFSPGRSNAVPWTRRYQYDMGEQVDRGAAWQELLQGRMA